MNRTHVARFVWKDYRRLRGFWLAVVVFWIGGLSLAASIDSANGPVAVRFNAHQVLFAILTTAAFYCLGCAGITFASEHEENTFPYLRSLPVCAESVFYGKLCYGLVSTVLLVVTLSVLCWLHQIMLGNGINYDWKSDEILRLQVFAAGAGLPLALAWGLWWSQRVKRPLTAIGLAAVCSVITIYAAVVMVVLAIGGEFDPSPPSSWAAGNWMLLICFVVSALVLGFARTHASYWLPNAMVAGARRVRRQRASQTVKSSRPSGVGRLFWLQLRQSGRSYAIWAFVGVALGVLGLSLGLPFPVFALAVVAILGMITFRREQDDRRYQLLGQLGVRAFPYWFSATVIPLVASTTISVLMAEGIQNEWQALENRNDLPWFIPVFCLGIATFGFAQWCTLVFRSIVIVMAVTLAAATAAWIWLAVNYLLGAPVWLSMFPVAVLPLVASYLRIPAWLRATDSRRAWVKPAAALLLLVVGVPLGTASFRIFQIPSVALPFVAEDRPLWLGAGFPVAEETGASYVRVAEAVDVELRMGGDRRSILLSASFRPDLWQVDEDQVAKLRQLSQREHCIFPPITAESERLSRSAVLAAGLLIADAQLNIREGNLAQAWSRYQTVLRIARQRNDGRSGAFGALIGYEIEAAVYRDLVPWCMEEGNSAAQIREAAAWLDEYRRQQPPWTHPLKGGYALTSKLINDPAFANETLDERERLTQQLARALAPWELLRARRLRDYLAIQSFRQLSEMQADADPHALHNKVDKSNPSWLRSSPFPMHVVGFFSFGRAAADTENQRRGTVYQLVAIAYHHEQGHYPESFDDADAASDLPLPDNLFGAGKMKIVEGGNSHFVVTAIEYFARSLPTGEQQYRHFLLPDFSHWNRENYLNYQLYGKLRPSDLPSRATLIKEADRFGGQDPFDTH